METAASAQPVRVPKMAEVVAAAIRSQIVRGELREGDSLPAEPELTVRYGISRPTLREALRILEAESLISLRRGARDGARVHAPSPDVAARYAGLLLQTEGATLADVYEARVLVIPHAARLLAQRRTADDLDRLDAFADELASLADAPEAFLPRSASFNALLLELAGNRTLLLLGRLLNGIIEQHLAAAAADWSRRPREREARNVVEAIRHLRGLVADRRADDAETWWRDQMRASASYSLKLHGARTVVDLLG
jgi:DNA-binding FadR family transcriptional regulator